MSTIRRDYAADAFDVLKQRDSTPRATALLNKVYEAQSEARDAEKQRELEVLEFSLGLHTRHREDLTEAGALHYEKRLEKIVGAADAV